MSEAESASGAQRPIVSPTGKATQVKLVLLGLCLFSISLSFFFLVLKMWTHLFFFIIYKYTIYYFTGESGVGKSSLVMRFVNREYVENREPTIGGIYISFI